MGSRFHLSYVALATCLAFVLPPATQAQAPAAVAETPSPRFEIVRFAVEGNTLLKPQEIEKAVAPFVGGQKDFADIQRALEALEQVYRGYGYGVVQVMLPEQDITRGVVRLRVLEPRIGKVVVEDNKYFNESNIRASLPQLKEGATPNSHRIAQNLQLLGEHPVKKTMVLLKSGATENEVDATVKVTDENPLRFFATLDNSGTKETGRERVGVGFQHSNLFNRDHVLNMQYVTSPTRPNDVTILGAGYRIPFYAQSSSLDLIAGYSDVNSGTLQNLFTVSGRGSIYLARYNLHLQKIGEFEQKISFGLDYKAFQNAVLLQGVGLVPDITVHPVSAAYSGLWRMTGAELGFYASVSQNLFPGGNDGADVDFKASRLDARAGYRIFRAGMNYNRSLPKDWQVRAVFTGQYSMDALVAGEQFGFGGPDSVRGFNIREVAGDRGHSTNLELYTPQLGALLGWKDVRMRALVFYDMGTTTRNSIQPGELSGQSGGSVGFGVRIAAGKTLSVRVDVAQVIEPA
ncbi:MAG: ShlB/FhaC/HecB family hemolysin secretion/activation protein, partial [Pseudomonadota bacterium]